MSPTVPSRDENSFRIFEFLQTNVDNGLKNIKRDYPIRRVSMVMIVLTVSL